MLVALLVDGKIKAVCQIIELPYIVFQADRQPARMRLRGEEAVKIELILRSQRKPRGVAVTVDIVRVNTVAAFCRSLCSRRYPCVRA